MQKLLIWLDNGQNVQTTSNVAADLAGLINAGTDKIYQCVDAISGQAVYIVVDRIVSFQDVTAL